jgi:hypothetical protein
MRLRANRTGRAISVIASAVLICVLAPTRASDLPDWRKSYEAFVKAVDAFPRDDVPGCKVEVGHISGERAAAETAMMRRFGGPVEFEGVFQGVVTIEPPQSPQTKKQKVAVALSRPEGLSGNTEWKVHLYPKSGSLRAWKALKPNTRVRFTAVVTGITRFHPVIYGVPHLNGMSILLEDGEIVRK